MDDKADVPVYTPILRSTGVRLRIENPVYEEGFDHRRRFGKKGIISDPKTGKRYLIKGKACNLANCKCDAWAEELSN